jgi:hypothetical protein
MASKHQENPLERKNKKVKEIGRDNKRQGISRKRTFIQLRTRGTAGYCDSVFPSPHTTSDEHYQHHVSS